ncbi:hypothetical protein CAPTEDRAFT_217989 [Capitella teleta]|uniref:Uncharacterized protein n=1 Tax=Capitella teleta TaxID=283909 RepID=R7T8B8_CAPTE|nr:hypothetical protein CAPTEDRAFT_217989 [Capitella teleta]|eukprot:ELT89924.1 hypothetical protein CAPTEDRAFT_217989 [Capitella teleta]
MNAGQVLSNMRVKLSNETESESNERKAIVLSNIRVKLSNETESESNERRAKVLKRISNESSDQTKKRPEYGQRQMRQKRSLTQNDDDILSANAFDIYAITISNNDHRLIGYSAVFLLEMKKVGLYTQLNLANEQESIRYHKSCTVWRVNAICNNKSMSIGIEIGMIDCTVEYNMCEMNDANGDGKCHVLCELKDWQVGQPFNLLLLIKGDSDMELCAVEANLKPWKQGRNVIEDWNSKHIAINE